MPQVAPEIEGLEIGGRCLSANTVSGDFFDYLQANGQVAIAVGDVTGHGMQGAMNAVMASGMLRTLSGELSTISPQILLAKLNTALKSQMSEAMNITMVIGLINGVAKTLVLVKEDFNHVIGKSSKCDQTLWCPSRPERRIVAD